MRSFLWVHKMATDVDVQYFSHLNGLTLGNNWGDLIRLLDKALVTGIDFTQITAASIDEQGDVHITLYSAHNTLLFQVVELSGFTPNSLNQKYRIKGVPNSTQLILKPALDIAERSITTIGAGKLASLGYEIIFRDQNDVKRVYRAKNPNEQHPYIRVDESLTSPDGASGIYASTYAKFAMVGLLEHMEHIDDYFNTSIQQLPYDPGNPAKNWEIVGTGTNVIRGWSKWYWATNNDIPTNNIKEQTAAVTKNREFTLCGNMDAFYINTALSASSTYKACYGCGVLNFNDRSIEKSWFLSTIHRRVNAGTTLLPTGFEGLSPIASSEAAARIFVTPHNTSDSAAAHRWAQPITKDYQTGLSGIFSAGAVSGVQVPVFDQDKRLRGTLPHMLYAGRRLSTGVTTPTISDSSMIVADTINMSEAYQYGNIFYYLGDLE